MERGGETELDRVFAALADPTRRAILNTLLGGPQRVSELAAPLPMSLAAVSKHVGILVRAGLVSQSRIGRERSCRLEAEGLHAAAVWMRGFGGFDAEDYDALEKLVALVLGEEEEGTEEDRSP